MRQITMQETGNKFPKMTDFSFTDDSFDYNITTSYFLSIRIAPDGFSFCTLDPVINKFIQIQHIKFDKKRSLIEQVEECFVKYGKLNLPYKKTLILVPSLQSTLVPSAIYMEEEKDTWMTFTNNVERENNTIISTKIKLADAVHLFKIKNEIKELMNKQFQEPMFIHPHSPIIESNLSTNLTDGDNKLLFLNIESNYVDILVFGNNNLQLCNTFTIKSGNDFIYFTLFVFEQMKINVANVSVIVSGQHPNFDEMLNHLRKYIKNVQSAKLPHQFQYSHLFKDINPPAFHTLLNLSSCV